MKKPRRPGSHAVPHTTLNPVVQVLDRSSGGRAPRNCDLLDIPTEHLVLFANGDIAWCKKHQLREEHEVELRHRFEMRFPRSSDLPCAGVKQVL
jgi:hypothetical protein